MLLPIAATAAAVLIIAGAILWRAAADADYAGASYA